MVEEMFSTRSGRVTVPNGQTRVIIFGAFKAKTKAIYRIFNSGKEGKEVEITEDGAPLHKLYFKDSVDVVVGDKSIEVTANAGVVAEIVYDLVATFEGT